MDDAVRIAWTFVPFQRLVHSPTSARFPKSIWPFATATPLLHATLALGGDGSCTLHAFN
jgi:hypothetical protein